MSNYNMIWHKNNLLFVLQMVYGAMGRLLRAIKLYLVPSILSNEYFMFI